MKKFFTWKNFIKLLGLLVLLCALAYFLADRARLHAGEIFNRQMTKYSATLGKIKVQKIWADVFGNVYFDKLTWSDFQGNPVLEAKSGRIRISVFDVIFKTIGLGSVRELELHQPVICIGFDEDMHLYFLEHEKKEARKQLHEHKPVTLNKQFFKDRVPDVRLILKDATLSVDYPGRQFIFHDLDMQANITNHENLELQLSTDRFDGSIIGDGMQLSGKVKFLKQGTEGRLNLALYEVVPASLGLGKINLPMTVYGDVSGELKSPIIKGAVSMRELKLPPLIFRKLQGNYEYNQGKIILDDVTGTILGGNVEATGVYYFDERSYQLNIIGRDLMAGAALKDNKLRCRADLNLRMNCEGPGKPVYSYGAVTSEGGSYSLIPFSHLSASFSNVERELDFTNVELDTPFGTFKTDALEINHGKVKLNPIYLVEENGKVELVK